jgi:hypothetical protein
MKATLPAQILAAVGALAMSACGVAQTPAKAEIAGANTPDTASDTARSDASSGPGSQEYTKGPDERLDPSSPEFASWLKKKTKEVEDFVGSARLPISIKTYLSEFLDTKEIVAELATKQKFRLRSGSTEARFLDSVCEPLTWTDVLSLKPVSFSDFDWDLCTPPGYNIAGTSPEFSIYWIRNRLGPDDESYQGYFPLPLARAMQELQYSLREALREYLASPSNLRGIYNLERGGLVSEVAELDPELRDLVAKRLRRIAELFAVARNACSRASCKAKASDFSTAKDRFDLNGFVGTSPMRDLVGYDNLELWEIRSLEFAARRFTEGDAPLVAEYISITNDAAAILNVSKSE